jgi:hypothetical protein
MAEVRVGGEQSEEARDRVRQTLTQLKTYLAQENPRRLSEADTKAHFIDPIITALGWTGIGSVTREYYVRNSQEFIDYVMFGPRPPQNQRGPLLAIEAKALQNELTEKHAAQLIQYCSVEGIEWAALTNSRELQFFNSFLKPDLEAKRVLKLDLLAFNTDDEFDVLFDQLWRLSRASLTEPSGVRTWLNQLRLDAELRQIMLDPSSQTIRQLRRHLNQVDVSASANDLVAWFRNHLAPPLLAMPSSKGVGVSPPIESTPVQTSSSIGPSPQDGPDIPGWENVYGLDRWPNVREIFLALYTAVNQRWDDIEWRATKYYVAANKGAETFLVARTRKTNLPVGLTLPLGTTHPRLVGDVSAFSWNRITGALDLHSVQEIDGEFLALVGQAREFAQRGPEASTQSRRVTLKDLVESGLLTPGASLILKAGANEVAEARVTGDGQIDLNGMTYDTPSNGAFARLLGPTRTTLNGWIHWHVRLPDGDFLLSDFRERFRDKHPTVGSRTA